MLDLPADSRLGGVSVTIDAQDGWSVNKIHDELISVMGLRKRINVKEINAIFVRLGLHDSPWGREKVNAALRRMVAAGLAYRIRVNRKSVIISGPKPEEVRKEVIDGILSIYGEDWLTIAKIRGELELISCDAEKNEVEMAMKLLCDTGEMSCITRRQRRFFKLKTIVTLDANIPSILEQYMDKRRGVINVPGEC